MTRRSPLLVLALFAGLDAMGPAPAWSQEVLGLEQLLDQVDRNYPKLLGAEVERQVSDAKLLEKQGAFDPVLNFKSEELDFLDGTQEVTKRKNQLTFEVPTRAGIKWFAGARLTDTSIAGKKGTKNYERALLGVEIPLIRNSRWNAKLVAERQAALGRPLAKTEVEALRLEILEKAGATYWDWVASARALDVSREMLALARDRAAAVAKQVERGDKAQLVSIEAQREVEKRTGIVAKAERNLQKAGLKLALFLWSDEGDPSDPPEASLAPPTFPDPADLDEEALQEAEETALERRPALRGLEIRKQIHVLDRQQATNEGNPDLSLFLNSGKESPLDVFEPLERRLRAGIKVSVPLRRRSPRGQAEAARLKLRKLDLEWKLLEQQVRTEVRDAASRLRTDLARLEAAERELELARALERGERTNFELGEGTLFLVNQRERSRAEAEVKRIEVAADYQQAWLGFRAVTADF